jgi:hypothetical protein
MVESEMSDLSIEQRIECLESIEAIKRLKYLYCRYCDAGFDHERISSLFVTDAVADCGAGPIAGAKAIAEKFKDESTRIPFSAHMVTNPIITVDGDTGHGNWWIIMPSTLMSGEKATGHWFVGEYDDDYVRVDGEWKFKRLRVSEKFWTPHLEDWALASLGRA